MDIHGKTACSMKLWDALFPRVCVSCKQEGKLLCEGCRADLVVDGPPFAYANPIIRQLVCAWKYDGDGEALRVLCGFLHGRLESLRLHVRAMNVDAIVPMPLSLWKERWRGFHQTKQLAHMLGAMLALPVCDALERKHGWRAQASMAREHRKGSLKKGKVMWVRDGVELPKAVLLIDDVETTGATLDVAEAALREAGVETVVRWTLARG